MARNSMWDGVERRKGEERRTGGDRREQSRTVWERRSGLDRRGHKLYSALVHGETPIRTHQEGEMVEVRP